MATYIELANIQSAAGWSDFLNKVRVAAVLKAVALLDSATPTAAQVAWAKSTLASPNQGGDDVVWYVIGANAGVALSSILAASDTAVQNNVNAAVDVITAGGI